MDDKLKLVIKVAAIALTAPATIEVAGSIYSDNIIYRVMVQAAALVLVEGALMLGWHKLDTEKTATTAQRWLYAGIAIVAYIVLWAVAWAHQEGGAAWFRATLGVLLVYSIAESGIANSIKINADGARNILNDLQVKMHSRRLDRKEAQAERSAASAVRLAFIEAQKSGGLHAAKLFGNELQAENDATHKDAGLSVTHEPTHKPPRKWDEWADPRAESKDDAKATVAALLKDDPDISNYRLGKLVGRSDTTIRKYRKELEAEHEAVIRTNGHVGRS